MQFISYDFSLIGKNLSKKMIDLTAAMSILDYFIDKVDVSTY